MQHSEIQELIPLYALDGMSADESAHIAQHLAVCPSCRALLNEYQFVADEMLTQVPSLTAPAYIGARLQNLAEADARKARHIVPSRHKLGVPPTKHPRFWNQPFFLPRWVLVLSLLIALLLVGFASVLAYRLQTNAAAPQQVMQLLTTNQIKYVELTGAGAPENYGFLCITTNNSTGLLWLHDLNYLDHEHVYQVWLRNGTVRVNGGTFRPDDGGRAVTLIQAPRPLTEYTDIGITIEPVAGSQGPTTARVIGGKLD